MKRFAKQFVPALIAVLLLSGLLLVPAEPVLAKTHFFFGLNIGIPMVPHAVYPYPAPSRVYYPPAYRAYPPCAQVWTPGYYDPYGNWVFGYYRYACPPYGY
ncbi:hypothetical protein [Candidatus Methylomirabilis sp.]|uniref:hypothetical protein n=1 Tax=Candidatus Methylomirabilis sp. TaxID=2032687 RepID=UPI002A6694EB|nr:hypothetical protein [Candidatus Methylomirabilis sp.]